MNSGSTSLKLQRLLYSAPRRSQYQRASISARALGSGRKDPRSENVGLDLEDAFFVDQTCIDCDTCRWMCPNTFARAGRMSAVVAQPQSADERLKAFQALLSCPTHSIHVKKVKPGELSKAQDSFPIAVEPCKDVYHCGFHAETSYAAASYFVVRPQHGNIMIDSPRYNPVLAKQIEKLGGVKYIFLTHRDDVADHAEWAKHLKAERIIHEIEVNRGTANVERKLHGTGPWRVDDGDDVEIIFTPGHTAGHCCLLHHPSATLFSGDHLSESRTCSGELIIFRDYNWYSVEEQVESVRRLATMHWLHLLPGHGRRTHFDCIEQRDEAIATLLAAETVGVRTR